MSYTDVVQWKILSTGRLSEHVLHVIRLVMCHACGFDVIMLPGGGK